MSRFVQRSHADSNRSSQQDSEPESGRGRNYNGRSQLIKDRSRSHYNSEESYTPRSGRYATSSAKSHRSHYKSPLRGYDEHERGRRIPSSESTKSKRYSSSVRLNSDRSDKIGERSSSPSLSRLIRCKQCSRTFKNSSEYEKHLDTHTPDDLVCKECGKEFNQFRNLKTHMRSHTGHTPFECDVCGRSFAQFRNLKTHKRRHTGEKPYSCEECGQSFVSASIMKDHKKKHVDPTYVPFCERNRGPKL